MKLLLGSMFMAFGLLAAMTSLTTAQEKNAKPLFEKTDELTDKDPLGKYQKKSYAKTHEMTMEAGKAYRIDLSSKDFDSFLFIESPEGKLLGFDDDGAGVPNSDARLVIKAPKNGDYKIIVTTFNPAETGKYTLTVIEPSKADLRTVTARDFARLPAPERTRFLEELTEHFQEQGKKLSIQDMQIAMMVASSLDGAKTAGSGDWLLKSGKAFAQSDNPQVKESSKTFEGIGRRVRLPGNSMEIKGTLLDGKKIEWDSYRGKVVLVDFWATWCGPCVGEIPNMKKMYDAYKGRGFDIVGISLDRDGDAPQKFMEKKDLGWACIFERDSKSQPLAEYYGVMAIPLAILVDKEGKVVSMNARGQELNRQLERLLGPIAEAKTEEK